MPWTRTWSLGAEWPTDINMAPKGEETTDMYKTDLNMASMWLQKAAQTMNIHIVLGIRWPPPAPWQCGPRTSIWPQTSTWPPVAAQTMEIHMNLKLQLGLGQQHGTWITSWPLEAIWTIEIFQGDPIKKMNHSSSQTSCSCSEPG